MLYKAAYIQQELRSSGIDCKVPDSLEGRAQNDWDSQQLKASFAEVSECGELACSRSNAPPPTLVSLVPSGRARRQASGRATELADFGALCCKWENDESAFTWHPSVFFLLSGRKAKSHSLRTFSRTGSQTCSDRKEASHPANWSGFSKRLT